MTYIFIIWLLLFFFNIFFGIDILNEQNKKLKKPDNFDDQKYFDIDHIIFSLFYSSLKLYKILTKIKLYLFLL